MIEYSTTIIILNILLANRSFKNEKNNLFYFKK